MAQNIWTRIKKDYLAGKRPKQLAEKYKCKATYSQIRNRIKKYGWSKLKTEIDKKSTRKLKQEIPDKEVREILQLKERERKDMYFAVGKLNLLIKGAKKKLSMNMMKDYSIAYKKMQDILYRSFGIAEKMEVSAPGGGPLAIVEKALGCESK